MRRRRGPENSSLELLLDTICNTFGGILFLAILVCVLLRNSATLPSSEDAAECEAQMQAASQQYEDLLAELRSLDAAEKQQEALRGRLTTEDGNSLLAQWKAAGQARDQLLVDKTRLLRDIADARTRIAAKESADQRLQAELRAAEQRLQIVRAQLDRMSKQRVRSARIPRLHRSYKSEVALLVRYNRAYFWHEYDRTGNRLGLNHEDCVVVEDKGKHLETTPKPYAGIEVGGAQWEAKLQKRLKVFDSAKHAIVLVVWPDSFEAFQEIKAAVVGHGFEYRILPVGADGKIVDRGGNSYVQ